MPSFPQPGTVTICEINRDLITADELSDDAAKDTYGKVLGILFSPVPFQAKNLLSALNSEKCPERKDMGPLWATIRVLFTGSLKYYFEPIDIKLFQAVDFYVLGWHQHKHILAFISGPHQVTIRDYEDSEGESLCILINESQKDVGSLSWRPNGGRELAVACKGGICIWAASYPGNTASVRSGVTLGTLSRGSGSKWTLVDFLLNPDKNEQITALSWSPNGKYLASASFDSSSFIIWDVAQGVGTPIRRGLAGISLLRWSPSGDYFLSAKFDGTFHIWETKTWTSERWSSANGFVKAAAWAPDGRILLVIFSESSTLGSIHFAARPPSLDAHLIPVELPEIESLTGSREIDKIAWDASGARLAVSYRDGDELYRGLIAIYDVRRSPLISASLVGFIRGPGWFDPKPVAFSFHNKFKQGPLLSVCWSSGFCCTYPLILRSDVLP